MNALALLRPPPAIAPAASAPAAAWVAYVQEGPVDGILHRFLEAEAFLPNHDYWSVLGRIWCWVELAHPHLATWRRLFTSSRPEREAAMSSHEQERLAALPDQVRVFRATPREAEDVGLGWTLDVEVARRFAEYSCSERMAFLTGHGCEPVSDGQPIILTAMVPRASIVLLLEDRDECTVVIPHAALFAPSALDG